MLAMQKISKFVPYKKVILVKFTSKTLTISELRNPEKLMDRASKWWIAKADNVKDVGHLIAAVEGEIIAVYKCGDLDKVPKQNSIQFKTDKKNHFRIKLDLKPDDSESAKSLIGKKINDNARWPFRVTETSKLKVEENENLIDADVNYSIGAGGDVYASVDDESLGNYNAEFSISEEDNNDYGDVNLIIEGEGSDGNSFNTSILDAYNRNSIDMPEFNSQEDQDEYEKVMNKFNGDLVNDIEEIIKSMILEYLSNK